MKPHESFFYLTGITKMSTMQGCDSHLDCNCVGQISTAMAMVLCVQHTQTMRDNQGSLQLVFTYPVLLPKACVCDGLFLERPRLSGGPAVLQCLATLDYCCLALDACASLELELVEIKGPVDA